MNKNRILAIVASVLLIVAIVLGIYFIISSDNDNDDSSIDSSHSRLSNSRRNLTRNNTEEEDSESGDGNEGYIRQDRTNTRPATGETNNNSGAGTGIGRSATGGGTRGASGGETISNNINPTNPGENNEAGDKVNDPETPTNPKDPIAPVVPGPKKEKEPVVPVPKDPDVPKDPESVAPSVDTSQTMKHSYNTKAVQLSSLIEAGIINPGNDFTEDDFIVWHKAIELPVALSTSSYVTFEEESDDDGWEPGLPTYAGDWLLKISYIDKNGTVIILADEEDGLVITIHPAELVISIAYSFKEGSMPIPGLDTLTVEVNVVDDDEGIHPAGFHTTQWGWIDEEDAFNAIDDAIYDVYEIQQTDAGKKTFAVLVTAECGNYQEETFVLDELSIPFRINVYRGNEFTPLKGDTVYIGAASFGTTYTTLKECDKEVIISYTLGRADGISIVQWRGVEEIVEVNSRRVTYTVNPLDARDGVIDIYADFIHISFAIDESSIDFGTVTCKDSKSVEVYVTNTGNVPIGEILIINSNDDAFDVSSSSISVDDIADVTISTIGNNLDNGEYEGTITFQVGEFQKVLYVSFVYEHNEATCKDCNPCLDGCVADLKCGEACDNQYCTDYNKIYICASKDCASCNPCYDGCVAVLECGDRCKNPLCDSYDIAVKCGLKVCKDCNPCIVNCISKQACGKVCDNKLCENFGKKYECGLGSCKDCNPPCVSDAKIVSVDISKSSYFVIYTQWTLRIKVQEGSEIFDVEISRNSTSSSSSNTSQTVTIGHYTYTFSWSSYANIRNATNAELQTAVRITNTTCSCH